MGSTSICPRCGAPGRCACTVSRLSLVELAESAPATDPYFTRLVRELKPGVLVSPDRARSSTLADLIERDDLVGADRVVEGLLESLGARRRSSRRAWLALGLLGAALTGVFVGLTLF